jgi:hypothetical protein
MQLGKRPRKPESTPPADSLDLGSIAKDEIQRAEPTVKVDRSTTPVEAELVDVNRKLAGLARTIKSHKRRAVESILAIGEALKESQVLLSHSRGEWRKFVADRCEFSTRTAYNYLAIHDAFSDCERVAQLIESPDVARKLATADGSVVRKAKAILNAGEAIDAVKCRELLSAPPAPKKSREAPLIFKCAFGSVAVIAEAGCPPERVLLTILKEIQASKAA